MVAKYWFERLARLPVEIEVASELRYREPPMSANGVCIAVSQSGETVDTAGGSALRQGAPANHPVRSERS
jgi:glucosamine 6-phosphate synthetase-like amidotransferase/phosphosugar isomerase protein